MGFAIAGTAIPNGTPIAVKGVTPGGLAMAGNVITPRLMPVALTARISLSQASRP